MPDLCIDLLLCYIRWPKGHIDPGHEEVTSTFAMWYLSLKFFPKILSVSSSFLSKPLLTRVHWTCSLRAQKQWAAEMTHLKEWKSESEGYKKGDDIHQSGQGQAGDEMTHRLLSKLPLHAMCSLFSSWILSSNTFVKLTLNTTPSYLKWTIQGLFSCSTPSSPTTFSHLIPWPHSQSPMGIGVFVFPDGVVEGSTGGGKVPLDPVSLESWQVRHFSLVSTQFPLPSSFGFSTITRLLQPLTGLGMRTNRTRMAEMEKRGIEPCIAKGPLATTAGRVCHPEMDFNHGNWSFLRMH